MPLRRDIQEVLEAIPARIEVSGHAPTWRVTGGSFEDVVAFARTAYDDPIVVAREDRHRWWPRVTLTVTTDPELAASAPPLEAFSDPEPEPLVIKVKQARSAAPVVPPPTPPIAATSATPPAPVAARVPSPRTSPDPLREPANLANLAEPEPEPEPEPESALEALFAAQEDLWRKRPRRFPRQRQRHED